MPEMHLRQARFAHSVYRPFTKNKETIKKFKETGDSRDIQNELNKACFGHDITYGYFKDLPRRTTSNKVLNDKAFNIAKNTKILWWVSKRSSFNFLQIFHGDAVKNEAIQNKELVEELYKRISRKFEKSKVQLSFIDNICSADLADMQLISKFN